MKPGTTGNSLSKDYVVQEERRAMQKADAMHKEDPKLLEKEDATTAKSRNDEHSIEVQGEYR